MNQGRDRAVGHAPTTSTTSRHSRFVADFVGQGVFLPAIVLDAAARGCAPNWACSRRAECAAARWLRPRRRGRRAAARPTTSSTTTRARWQARGGGARPSAAPTSSTRCALASGAARAVAGAVAPRPRDRRADRHPAGDRPRGGVSGGGVTESQTAAGRSRSARRTPVIAKKQTWGTIVP
ncbi:MAG: hypothetical protein MZW92_70615 [Comamonadaceae bacterium]|nr:hypothetical protein [Comamonadaceae bacterium]